MRSSMTLCRESRLVAMPGEGESSNTKLAVLRRIMRLKLDWSIKVSDLLTSITIVVSVIALLISWSKDREAKLTEQANRVRIAAATAIAKLDRWQALQLSMYRELQPTYVEMSELLTDRYDVQRVRDQFWKRVNIERTAQHCPVRQQERRGCPAGCQGRNCPYQYNGREKIGKTNAHRGSGRGAV